MINWYESWLKHLKVGEPVWIRLSDTEHLEGRVQSVSGSKILLDNGDSYSSETGFGVYMAPGRLVRSQPDPDSHEALVKEVEGSLIFGSDALHDLDKLSDSTLRQILKELQ